MEGAIRQCSTQHTHAIQAANQTSSQPSELHCAEAFIHLFTLLVHYSLILSITSILCPNAHYEHPGKRL